MQPVHSIDGALLIGCAGLVLQACGKSDSGAGGGGAGASGAYASVGTDGLTLELTSGGTVTLTAEGLGKSSGTYTVDGEKIIVSIDNQTHTFIRDGNYIEEPRDIIGKLCKGGKAGEASNVSTRNVPTAPTGTYVTTNADGEFKIEFKPGNTLILTFAPTGGAPESHDATFTIEGDKLYATLPQSTPMILTFVNNAYETTSLGPPMRFVKQ